MIAAKVASSGALQRIADQWRMPQELATDLVKLSLYDVVLYVDGESSDRGQGPSGLVTDDIGTSDSGSMAFEENGERIDDLKALMGRVAYATSLFDQDGISVSTISTRVSEIEVQIFNFHTSFCGSTRSDS
jgi:hypothetical protein